MESFSKHYSKWKTVSIKIRKTIQERRLPDNIKNFTDNPPYNFWNFLILWKHFYNLTIFRDILRIFLKQKFVKCSLKILETLLYDYWNLSKDQHLLLSHPRLLTRKQLFHREFFKKCFPLKCSQSVPCMPGTL